MARGRGAGVAVLLWVRIRHPIQDGRVVRSHPEEAVCHAAVVSPFVDPSEVDDAVLRGLEALFDDAVAPQVRFSAVGWVGGVVYLKPEDTAPLQALAHAVEGAWPELRRRLRRPRLFHLTVARRQGPQGYRRARGALSRRLPLSAVLDEARLYAIRDANDAVLLGRFRLPVP